jgi:hypothetical protein
MTKLILTKGHVEDVSGFALSIKTAQIADPKTGLSKEGYIIYGVKTVNGKPSVQKIFNLEALRSIEVNGNSVCLNGAYRVDTPEWVNDRRAALEKAAKLARTTTPPKEKEDDKNITPTPSPVDAGTTPTATGDTGVTESENTPTEPVNGDDEEVNTDTDESQEIDSNANDEEIENPETEAADEVKDNNEEPAPAVREVTVKFENCKDAKHAKTTIPYGSNIYDVFKKLVETGAYDGMVTTEKYNFDGWEITIDDNGSTDIKGTNTELIKQYVEKGGLNIPANGNVTCNAHWSRK